MYIQAKNKIAQAKTATLSTMASAWKLVKYLVSLLTLGAMAGVWAMAEDNLASSSAKLSQTSTSAAEPSPLAPKTSLRPKVRPTHGDVSTLAPKTSLRPKARLDSFMRSWAIDKAIAEAMEQ